MLDFRRLHVLHAVAREGSMTRAAKALAFTPSAVSQHISSLEHQAGTPLLIRLKRGVQLTDAGRLLVEHTEAMLQRLATAQHELDDLIHLRAGRLRMATFPSAGARLLPAAITAFRRSHPDVELTLHSHSSDRSVELLRSGQLDLAVLYTYDFADLVDLTGINAVPLLQDTMHVALPAGHPLSDRSEVSAAQLRGEAWIQNHDPMCSRMLSHICGLAGFAPKVVFDSDDYATVSRLVEAGLGVAAVPSLAVDQMTHGVSVKPFAPRTARQVYATTTAEPTPAVHAMLDILTGLPQ
ncbi:LysR family transcriptional regulator [Streptomyces sp. WZ-12]|uniref:LysR family transcriptional regulator n=1 Tax=Streptomyces sp. WZ-12 TaxID=3030210 RepID=UPI0023813FA2|nr:LysR substrate-binding domain-containing protein [Streptomyces sp. WZ-12]